MMISPIEVEAKTQLDIGNYRQAEELYRKLLSKPANLRDRSHYADSVTFAEKKYREFHSLITGEAMCPVIDIRSGKGCLCILQTHKIVDNAGNLIHQDLDTPTEAFPRLSANWNSVTDAIVVFLNQFIINQKKISVLNWGWDCWRPSVRTLSHLPKGPANDPEVNHLSLHLLLLFSQISLINQLDLIMCLLAA